MICGRSMAGCGVMTLTAAVAYEFSSCCWFCCCCWMSALLIAGTPVAAMTAAAAALSMSAFACDIVM